MSLLTSFAPLQALTLVAVAALCTVAEAQTGGSPRTEVRYGYCFPGGGRLIYAKAPAKSVAECSQRCVADAKCAAFEIWDHNFTCKLYSAIPGEAPRPQTVFPKNRKQNGTQAQAALGIKVTEGF